MLPLVPFFGGGERREEHRLLLHLHGRVPFPERAAAEIAIDTVRQYKSETGSEMKVIFNVFKDLDKEIYERLLQRA